VVVEPLRIVNGAACLSCFLNIYWLAALVLTALLPFETRT
jgi:hypothetical protein